MPKIKAEMWDKMQYLFRNYYDRMVHAVLYYEGSVDASLVKKVLIYTLEKAPVLHSRFRDNGVDPVWIVEDYKIQDFLSVIETEEIDKEVESFITRQIPVDSNVQLRFAVISDGKRTAVAMIVNHMCLDGGDFKYFLTRFAENYTKLSEGDINLYIKTGSRSYDQVYTKLAPEEERTARGLYKNISAVKDKHSFPFTPDDPGRDRERIIRRKIDADLFEKFRKIGKSMDVTVNDLMLAVYIRALYDVGGFPADDALTIPCMVDLRRHIEGGAEAGGLTNHTGFMQCSCAGKGETVNDTLINVLRSVRKSKTDKYMGLYSLPLLKLAYTVLPFKISETAIKIGYLNPLMGMSNIGLLEPGKFSLGGKLPVDGFMTGAIKYKPYMQLAMTTFNGAVTMTIAVRCNDEDEKTVNRCFDLIIANINDFVELNKNRL